MHFPLVIMSVLKWLEFSNHEKFGRRLVNPVDAQKYDTGPDSKPVKTPGIPNSAMDK